MEIYTWESSSEICLLSVVANSEVRRNIIASGQNFLECLNTCAIFCSVHKQAQNSTREKSEN